jgi:hypothetical protein
MLVANEPIKNLGKVKFGKPHAFTFCVQNIGNGIIEITKIQVGCGSCTTAHVKNTHLRSGESTDINVVFTPGSTGEQKKFITVKWNNINDLKLSFTADSYE